jgi:hypothetical protein
MTALVRNGAVLAALQVAMVGGMAVKYAMDRSSLPRVWVQTAPYDPNEPIRGRYVSLRLAVVPGPGIDVEIPKPATEPNGPTWFAGLSKPVQLEVRDNQLVALPGPAGASNWAQNWVQAISRNGRVVVSLVEPVAYFIPDRIPDPSIRPAGEELWVEVSVPPHGPPRPIRLGVKKDGVLTPLEIK